MADLFALSMLTPIISFASFTPINNTPPAALAKAQTSSVISFTLEGIEILNSALYPSPDATNIFMSAAVTMFRF
ncbi:hypothetical protein D3C78_1325520 [compost metagenome]